MKSHGFVSGTGVPNVEVGCALGAGPDPFESAASAARQALARIRRHDPSLVLVFASVDQDLSAVLRGVRSVVGGTPLIGSTTAGEILDSEHHGSISLVVIASPHLQVHVGSGRGVSRDLEGAVDEALGAPGVAPYFRGDAEGSSPPTRTGRSAFAILLSPGNTSRPLSPSEDLLDVVLRRSLGRLPVFGGAAADDRAMRTNYVFAGVEAIEDGVVIAVIETDLQYLVSAALVVGNELTFAARVARENEALRREVEQKVVALARVHDDLNRAVADRTAELSAVNQQLRREIADRVHAEALARRTMRALRTLTECNEALVRASDEIALLTRVCRSVVESGGYRMCWVGFAEHDAEKRIRPVAHHGVAPGYLTVAGVTWSDADERGRGPVGTCIRTARPVVIHDVLRDPAFAPWRALAAQHRFGSMIALPLVVEERVLGAFAIYSGDVDAFAGEGEIRLLLDLAGDLAYGLSALRARAERSAMATRLVEADRLAAVGTLAAGVAHEINNPLAYVLSGIEYLEHVAERSASPEELAEARSALADIRTGSERIRHVVQDLKAFSRAPADEAALVDLRHVLDSAAKMTSNETRHRARLVKEYGDVPYVRASEARLAQVFVNLLINAAHAIPEGNAASNQIRLSTSVHDGRVLVEVSDTGTGIPESVRVRIFDPFFTTKPLGVGTGLGLSISRNIVAAAGGEITVHSEPGRGTTMRVLLPAAPEACPERPVATAAVRRPIGPRGRVLVVDDEEHVLSAIRRMLRDEHEVHCERTARSAVARIEAGERFDAMLCDLMMPDMTGVEFHAELASFAPALLERVVFMTGGAFTSSAETFLQRSGTAWLLKPFEADELRAAVRSRIGSP